MREDAPSRRTGRVGGGSSAPCPGGGKGIFFVVEPDRAQLAQLASLADAGRIRPVVGAVVTMAAGWAEGFAAKRTGGIAGKIVLQQDGQAKPER